MRQGVVFDLDGVLVKSEHLWEEAWRACAAACGIVWTPGDTRRCQGLNVAEWSAYLAQRTGSNAESAAADVVARVIEAYQAGRVRLVDGAADIVAGAASRGPVGLASSAPRSVIEVVMGTMGIGRYFSATVSSAEVARGKPSPDVYLEAIRQLRIDPSSSVGVEDSSNGVRAAVAAGLRVVAVVDPRYPLAADAAALAESIQPSLVEAGRDVTRLLDRHRPGASLP
jgi:HAD superfamily hydrolase (TIGR01509 family)